jgi:hypothetical protein
MIRRRPIQQQHRSLCAELWTAQREGGAVLEHARRKLVPGRALHLGDGREFGCDDRTDCAQLFHARGGIVEELLHIVWDTGSPAGAGDDTAKMIAAFG